jgi:hypothetical protein
MLAMLRVFIALSRWPIGKRVGSVQIAAGHREV